MSHHTEQSQPSVSGWPRGWRALARRRSAIQAASALLLNSYVTQNITKALPCPALNCYACPAAAFACPLGSLQHFIGQRSVPLYVLGMVALVGVFVGRGACGWLCPFGWLQELIYRLPVRKWRLPNRFTWTRYVVLGALVVALPLITREPWFCKVCPAGTLEAGIPTVLLFSDTRALVGALYWLKLGLLGGLVAWMGVTRRPFCRWVCPLGALWSPFNAVSSLRLHVDPERCVRCGHCQEVCPVDLPIYQQPTSGACIRCMRCLSECPTGAIHVGRPGWSLEAARAGTPVSVD
ncbi:MAG: 4Fe-4S binding protein [Anaerolineales bacterium]|nr:4Fe-4S binding protein [Anaerolineales bacterium]